MNNSEIARDVINKLSEENKKYISNIKEDDLITLHHTLGQSIRNEYGLWKRSWEPVLVNGVDHSDNHPDAISNFIIREIWESLK